MGHSLPRHSTSNMYLLFALASLVAAASAVPLTYYPAQYIPSDEMLVRVPRQVGPGPLGPSRREFQADQQASADTSYGAPPAPVGRVKIQVYRGPSKGTWRPRLDTTTNSP